MRDISPQRLMGRGGNNPQRPPATTSTWQQKWRIQPSSVAIQLGKMEPTQQSPQQQHRGSAGVHSRRSSKTRTTRDFWLARQCIHITPYSYAHTTLYACTQLVYACTQLTYAHTQPPYAYTPKCTPTHIHAHNHQIHSHNHCMHAQLLNAYTQPHMSHTYIQTHPYGYTPICIHTHTHTQTQPPYYAYTPLYLHTTHDIISVSQANSSHQQFKLCHTFCSIWWQTSAYQ